MPLKLESPLYSDSAHGTIQRLGTFVTRNGATYLHQQKGGNPNPNSGNTQLRTEMANALAAYSALTPSWAYIDGRWRYIRTPTWPVFWATWYAGL